MIYSITVPIFFGPFMSAFPLKNEITCVIHGIMVPSFFLGHKEITCVIHRGFYTQTLLHAVAFTHTHTFTHRGFYTQTLLYTEAFTLRRFYTQTLLPTEAFTHTHSLFFYTHTLSHTKAFIHRRLHRSLNSVYRCKWNADHSNNAHAKYLYLL